jgi:hypothetical protein
MEEEQLTCVTILEFWQPHLRETASAKRHYGGWYHITSCVCASLMKMEKRLIPLVHLLGQAKTVKSNQIYWNNLKHCSDR